MTRNPLLFLIICTRKIRFTNPPSHEFRRIARQFLSMSYQSFETLFIEQLHAFSQPFTRRDFDEPIK